MALISPDSEAIRREIADRGITYLCHFTTLRNATSMIRMGSLLSRRTLVDQAIPADFQDGLRFEGGQYINLSIQTPNHYLWRNFARKAPQKTWCLLRINPEVCLREGVKFTTGNASAFTVRCQGTALGVEGFRALFADRVIGTNCFRLRMKETPLSHPTSEQAEVLCPEPVSMADVFDIVVACDADKRALLSSVSVNPYFIKVDPTFFATLPHCA